MKRLKAVQIRVAAAGFFVVFAAVLGAARLSSAVADSSQADAAALFHHQTADFIEAELQLYPERATALGDHRFDNRVDDLTMAGVTAVINHAHKWIGIFSGDDSHALAPADESDREWLLAHLDSELLWTEQIRTYERDPGSYLPTSGINGLIKRDFAPLGVRIQSVAARETAALKNLEAARINLKADATPKVAVEITLDQMPATIAFFQHDVPLAFEKLPDGPDKTHFGQANAKLISSIQDYSKWLEQDLKPRAVGKYAIGAEAYRRMLEDDDMVDLPLEQLEQVGVNELARLQAEFVKTAALIDPNKPSAEVMKALTRDHPDGAGVLPAVAAGLENLRNYVTAHRLAKIPSDVLPLVRETPPYMRATTFASMDTPGPFEKSTEAFFYVTLPEPSWSEEKKSQLLAFYAEPAISDTSVHEVYPGHYVQFLNNHLLTDKVRQLYHSGANSEGWALYCEQMMLDEGLHSGDPKYRLAQVQMALMRACRYLAGIRMHTRGMTVDEAAKFFETNAYQTPHNAMVEALRGTDDPGYLRYQLGKLMILRLREDVRGKEGAAFELGKFHDDFLKQGGMPLKLIRRAMLGGDGPLL